MFSSVGGAERESGVPHFESKRRVEEHIEALGIHHTFLRPVLFMDNLSGFMTSVENGQVVVRMALPDGIPPPPAGTSAPDRLPGRRGIHHERRHHAFTAARRSTPRVRRLSSLRLACPSKRYGVRMRDFTEDEDRLWRTLMRLNGALPRLLDDDLRGSGLTLSEFAVLLVLSEAESGELWMSGLAATAGLSPSRTTRVVADLERRGFAEKVKSSVDARSAVARVTQQGRDAVRKAYPIQVDRARGALFDHLDPAQIRAAAAMLEPFLRRVLELNRPS